MKQATHFIEQIKHEGQIRSLTAEPIRLFKWALETNKKFGIETIAIFKIYPKK